MTLTTLLIVFLLVFLLWGGFGYGRATPGPYASAWSPLGFTAAVLLVLYLTGHLR